MELSSNYLLTRRWNLLNYLNVLTCVFLMMTELLKKVWPSVCEYDKHVMISLTVFVAWRGLRSCCYYRLIHLFLKLTFICSFLHTFRGSNLSSITVVNPISHTSSPWPSWLTLKDVEPETHLWSEVNKLRVTVLPDLRGPSLSCEWPLGFTELLVSADADGAGGAVHEYLMLEGEAVRVEADAHWPRERPFAWAATGPHGTASCCCSTSQPHASHDAAPKPLAQVWRAARARKKITFCSAYRILSTHSCLTKSIRHVRVQSKSNSIIWIHFKTHF